MVLACVEGDHLLGEARAGRGHDRGHGGGRLGRHGPEVRRRTGGRRAQAHARGVA